MGQTNSNEAKALRNQYDLVKQKLSANPTFNELVHISLAARLKLLPTRFFMLLSAEVDVCKKLIYFFQTAENDVSPLSHNMCLGNLVLAATGVFEGYVLRLENKIDSKKYTETKLLSIITDKMKHILVLFEEIKKKTLILSFIDETDMVSFSDMIQQKEHFLELAPTWLGEIHAVGSDEQVGRFVKNVIVIVLLHSGVKFHGFVAMDGKYVYVSKNRRPQTIRHELSHGLLKHLQLNLDHPPTSTELLDVALQFSPLKYDLNIDGETVEAGWNFENKHLGTEQGPHDEWPVFCVDDVEEIDICI